MVGTDDDDAVITAQLAKHESMEHMIGMDIVYAEFRKRPMTIRARSYGADGCRMPTVSSTATATEPATIRHIKMIHFIRHGQGFHNLLADLATKSGITWRQFESTNGNDPSLPNNNPYMHPDVLDAPLTESGRKQAQRLHYEIIQNNIPIDCVYVSPHCRTLQTGLIAFGHTTTTTNPITSTTVPLIAHELLREESGVHVCDQRRTISWQHVEFPQYDFHTYCPSDIDPLFHPHIRETKMQVAQRIYEFMEFISQLDGDNTSNNIAVITHSGWLHIFFNAIVQNDCHPKLKEWFQTGEMRSVEVEFIWN
jgi:broad specificity phosphatase PhoE